MYKYIFSDLDGTLLDDDKNVSSKNLSAINYAQDQGVKFIVCTGRSPFYMADILKQINHYEDATKLMIGFNGGIIIDGNMQVLDSRPMDKKLAEKLFLYGTNDKKVSVVACFEDSYLRYNVEALGDIAVKWKWNKSSTIEKILNEINNKKCYKIFFASKDHNYLDEIIKRIKKEISEDLEFAYSNECALEINPKGITKGEGIHRLLKMLNGDIEETIGIGDNINDLEMIKACKIGCCPSNATEEIKKISTYVCKNDNNHDAISEIIDKYIKGEQ